MARELVLKMTTLFNSIDEVERVDFIQFRPIDKEILKSGYESLGCGAGKCEAADILLVLTKAEAINYGITLDESIRRALELTKIHLTEVCREQFEAAFLIEYAAPYRPEHNRRGFNC